MNAIVPVILSGGSGTRLWPLSRSMYPKQFVRFFNGQGETFLGATLKRLDREAGFAAPVPGGNTDHPFPGQGGGEIERAGPEPRAIILEPVASNTAAAIAVAALAAAGEDASAILAVMPSDHVITDKARFVDYVKRAAKVAATGRLTLFGMKPAAAQTGYGYIRKGEALEGFNGGAFAVEAFIEKPDLAAAGRPPAPRPPLRHTRTFFPTSPPLL